MSEQLYQVWDWEKNEAYNFYTVQLVAEREANRLNSLTATDWNGLPRYQAMEAND